MKTIIASILLTSIASVTAQDSKPVSTTQIQPKGLYERGLIAMNRGDVAAAEKNFRAVLQAQPEHPHARYALNKLLLNREKYAAVYRENMMKQTKIAKVEYSDAAVSECLESLTEQIKEATGQKFSPNFIIKDPAGKLKLNHVSLSLSNIPASQVLQYIASSAQCKIIYEEHAIVVQAK
jgi:hypothetical protein